MDFIILKVSWLQVPKIIQFLLVIVQPLLKWSYITRFIQIWSQRSKPRALQQKILNDLEISHSIRLAQWHKWNIFSDHTLEHLNSGTKSVPTSYMVVGQPANFSFILMCGGDRKIPLGFRVTFYSPFSPPKSPTI